MIFITKKGEELKIEKNVTCIFQLILQLKRVLIVLITRVRGAQRLTAFHQFKLVNINWQPISFLTTRVQWFTCTVQQLGYRQNQQGQYPICGALSAEHGILYLILELVEW